MAEEKKFDVKLLIDKEKNKLLFAESDKDFVDTLFTFLTLPIGSIISLTNRQSNLGCTDHLYHSVEALDSHYFKTVACKEKLLMPKNDAEISYGGLACTISPREKMNSALELTGTTVFLSGKGKFIITDDLQVYALSSNSSLSILDHFGIDDNTVLEERNVSVCTEEITELLKRSLLSTTVMTDVFLSKLKDINSNRIKMESSDYVQATPHKTDAKTLSLNIYVRRSQNKVLYAVANSDFLDFLYSFLTFPIGAAVKVLGRNSSVRSLGNLYITVENLSMEEPKRISAFRKAKLLSPMIAIQHGCKNQLLPIKESDTMAYIGHNPVISALLLFKNGGSFIKEFMSFTVTDELVVEPYSQISAISLVKKLHVPFKDIEERTITVGETEAKYLLKASLTSKTVLTDVFGKK